MHTTTCVFSDDGVQSTNDTACSVLPTATFTIGSPRTLTFERMTMKVTSGNWTKTACKHWVECQLDDGSILVLAASDDKPTLLPPNVKKLHKTKHRVEFQSDGVSIGFVFCPVRAQSKFDPATNRWMWQKENEPLK